MDIYDRLGVTKLINAAGNNTVIGGSLMPPEVLEAMTEASRSFVDLVELYRKVGAEIARLAQVEAAHISSGAAGGIVLATAACLTGADAGKIARLPDTTGIRNEVVLRRPAGPNYIHQGIRYTGARLRPVGTPQNLAAEEIEAAVTAQTAALFFIYLNDDEDLIRAGVDIACRHGLPTIVDAAAELPQPGGLSRFFDLGVDLTVFSGGKGLSGPQCTGLVLGNQDLVQAAALNSNPYSAIGRQMKVGKEEAVGLLRAVELFVARDEEGIKQRWQAQAEAIAAALADVPHVQVVVREGAQGGRPPAVPRAFITLDAAALGLTSEDLRLQLRAGNPRIDVSGGDHRIVVSPLTLQPGEEQVVAARLREILTRL